MNNLQVIDTHTKNNHTFLFITYPYDHEQINDVIFYREFATDFCSVHAPHKSYNFKLVQSAYEAYKGRKAYFE